NSLATGTTPAVQQGSGTFTIKGNGDAAFQNAVVTSTFNSLATGSTPAITQGSGTFSITGAGNAAFQQEAVAIKAAAVTGTGGGTGVGNALLSATTSGLYLSLNGGAPVLLTTGGTPPTPVQFGATFWNNGSALVPSAISASTVSPVDCTIVAWEMSIPA